MCEHQLVTQIDFPDPDTRIEQTWCKVCNKSLEEIEKEETPQNPEYRLEHLSEESIG